MIGYQYNDGGRSESGRKGNARDCVARAMAILTGKPYDECYKALADANKATGRTRSARGGLMPKVWTKVYSQYGIAKVALPKGPKPTLTEAYDIYGDCIISTRRHVAALINGNLQDTWDGRTYEFEDATHERKAMSIYKLTT